MNTCTYETNTKFNNWLLIKSTFFYVSWQLLPTERSEWVMDWEGWCGGTTTGPIKSTGRDSGACRDPGACMGLYWSLNMTEKLGVLV